MATSIHPTDIISVALQEGGRRLANLTLSGAADLGDLLRMVRSRAEGESGVIKVIVRNNTRGWVQQHTLVFRKSTAPKPERPKFLDYPTLF
ncbi:MAG: hypothetical protein NC039_00395 [Muribaculaceae bacterium]|nr:hypothetical protein [Muribaculaceae bacterium]